MKYPINRPTAALTLAASLAAGVTLAADRTQIPTPKTPEMKTFAGQRDVQYCEVWLFTGTPETGIWGTYAATDSYYNGYGPYSEPCGYGRVSTLPTLSRPDPARHVRGLKYHETRTR